MRGTRNWTLPILLAAASHVYATNLSLTSGLGAPGQQVVMQVVLSDAATRPVSALQFTVSYSAADFPIVSISAAPALLSAAKALTCAYAYQTIRCIVVGRNTLLIADGALAEIRATLSTSAAGSRYIGLSGTIGANSAGSMVNVTAAGGSVSVIGTAPDTTPPTVALQQPAPFAVVSGNVTVAATAADNAAVAGVRFFVDNVDLGIEVATPPYTTTWNSAAVSNGSHVITAQARDTAGLIANSSAVQVQVANATGAVSGLAFYPIPPCRAVDTRVTGKGAPRLAAQSTRTFTLPQSGCPIPATARALSVNITAVPVRTLAYLTTWPAGQPMPLVSTLNSFDGRIAANAALVPAGAAGAVNVYVTDEADVIIDVNGYFDAPAAGGLSFVPHGPCRVADSREGLPAPFGTPSYAAGSARTLPIPASTCAIPSTAQAYSFNVTAVPLAASLGYLSLWPAGQNFPNVSTLNSTSGTVVANAAIVPAGTQGAVQILVTDRADVVLDANGYFASSGALRFYPVTPCRVSDTRIGNQPLAANAVRDFQIPAGPCGIPATAQAYSLNITAVPAGTLQYITVWPTGRARPLASTLNSFTGTVTANAAIVAAGSSGAVSVYATNPTDIVIDINGYFAP